MADGPKIPLKDKPGSNNWVDKAGGLPDYIKRIAEHIKGENAEWDDGHCIAAAVNQVKEWAAGGEGVTAKTKAKAAAALAQWEAKKASTHASIQGDSDLALAAAALDDEFDEGAYRLALAAERASVGSTVEDDFDLMLVDGDAEVDEGRFMLAIQSERAARGIPLAGLTERPLDLSQSDGDTLDMAIHFDPQKHPRDLNGQFRSIVKGLKVGESVKLPDGTTVKSLDNGYRVGDSKVGSAREAADSALNKSAKSTDAKSIGGAKSYPSAATYQADSMADEDLKDVPAFQKGTPQKGDTPKTKAERGTSKDGEAGTVPTKPTGIKKLPSGQSVDWDRDPAKNSPATNAEVARQTDLPKDVRQPFVDAHNDLAERRGIPKIDIDGKPIDKGDATKRSGFTSNVLKGNPADSDTDAVKKNDARRQYAKDLTSEEMEPEIDAMTDEEVEDLIREQEAEQPDDEGRFQVITSKKGSSAPPGNWTQHESGDLEIEMPNNGPTARITEDEHGGRDKWGAYVFPDADATDSESRTDFDSAEEARKWVESRIESGDISPGDGDEGTEGVSDHEVFAAVTRAVDRMVDGGDENFSGSADEIREIHRGIQDPATLQETGMGWEVETILEEISELTERSENADDQRLYKWASKKLEALLAAE